MDKGNEQANEQRDKQKDEPNKKGNDPHKKITVTIQTREGQYETILMEEMDEKCPHEANKRETRTNKIQNTAASGNDA